MPPQEAIVCVDDEPLVLRALIGLLRRRLGERYRLETATNGREALALIEALEREDTATRMVLSDLRMPVMDGYELVERLHEDRPQVLTIVVTGYADPKRIDRLKRDAGLLATFDKPWDVKTLMGFLERTLATHNGEMPEA